MNQHLTQTIAYNGFSGFDFGTTNSAIGVCTKSGEPKLVPLENEMVIIPSALFFEYETSRFCYGQIAKTKFIDGVEGRLLMSLKSILGTDTINTKTKINGLEFSFLELIGLIFKNILNKAERTADREIDKVVMGRPIFFNETDSEKDRKAQEILTDIARQQGIKHVEFEYEPIAAAVAYESTISHEQIALIVDIGGGTSDFSVLRLSPHHNQAGRKSDILSYKGAYVGGNSFDKQISLKYIMPSLGKDTTFISSNKPLVVPHNLYLLFSSWHRINELYCDSIKDYIQSVMVTSKKPDLIKRFYLALEYEMGHIISSTVENAKIRLSQIPDTTIDLSIMGEKFSVDLDKNMLISSIEGELQQLLDLVDETIEMAGLDHSDIDTLFFTGGSTRFPLLRDAIIRSLPQADIVEGDAFTSVSLGLTIEAQRRFGEPVSAKMEPAAS